MNNSTILLMVSAVFFISCGSDQVKSNLDPENTVNASQIGESTIIPKDGADGEKGADGKDGADGIDTQKLSVIDVNGDELGQYAGVFGEMVTIFVGGKFAHIEEKRLNEETPYFRVSSQSNNCFYSSNDCTGTCYLNYNAPTNFLSIGKDGIYEIDFENGSRQENVGSLWQNGQCRFQDTTLQKARVGSPISELNYLLDIKGPISIE